MMVEKAFKILRAHYIGTGKSRVITLYTEMTALSKTTKVSLTDYIIRAETIANFSSSSGENISDAFLKRLISFKTYTILVTQRDKQMIFSEFKKQKTKDVNKLKIKLKTTREFVAEGNFVFWFGAQFNSTHNFTQSG